MPDILPLIAGNWKMNGLKCAAKEMRLLVRLLKVTRPRATVAICPPATLLPVLARIGRSGRVALGGQYCHSKPSGAHTGDISAAMLKDGGAAYCIVGHSERRQAYGETDALVLAQAEAAQAHGLIPIICIGESDAENRGGQTEAVLTRQIEGSVPRNGAGPIALAYEPIWAIGTGRTPKDDEIARLHAFIRARLINHCGAAAALIPVLYGGSVSPANAAKILAVPGVNGALVGGASLKARDFFAIIGCYGRARAAVAGHGQ